MMSDQMGGNILILTLFVVYLLPWLVAVSRSHPNVAAIFIINLFLGWTLIGWVVALAWAASAFMPRDEPKVSPTRGNPFPIGSANARARDASLSPHENKV